MKLLRRATRKLFFVLILLAGLLPLSGCQYDLEWYIRNLSSKEVVLTLYYENREIKHMNSYIPLKTKYADCKRKVIDITYETAGLLDDSLEVKQINSHTYQVRIPPHTIVEGTFIIPTQPRDAYYHFRNVVAVFEQDGMLTSFNSMDVFKKYSPFKSEGGFFLKNLMYFDYRNPGETAN